MDQEYVVFVRIHPSGGWCVNVPQNGSDLYVSTRALLYDKMLMLLTPFSVWRNSPAVQGCIELEFIREIGDGDFKKFQDWIRWTIGIHVPELKIETI